MSLHLILLKSISSEARQSKRIICLSIEGWPHETNSKWQERISHLLSEGHCSILQNSRCIVLQLQEAYSSSINKAKKLKYLDFVAELIVLLWTQNATDLQLRTSTCCFIWTLYDASHGLKTDMKNKATKQMEISHSCYNKTFMFLAIAYYICFKRS